MTRKISHNDIDTCGGAMSNQKNYSLSEVAAEVGVMPYQITYAITTGKIQEVQRFAGRRLFSESDLRLLKRHFALKKNKEKDEIQKTNDEGE
jgi:DNA-binding transcriptional MerR regulator